MSSCATSNTYFVQTDDHQLNSGIVMIIISSILLDFAIRYIKTGLRESDRPDR
jgi:hypothetical protein